MMPPILILGSDTPIYLSGLGVILEAGVILWFVWKLYVLTRLLEPWTIKRGSRPGLERPITRPGLPDYGEFGRFERLVYAAYAWLVLGACFEMILGAGVLSDYPLPIRDDAVRHIYLLGFITHLIFGMSVRMIPGFMKKKSIASPKLVDATFWLGNTAAVLRVLPLILPATLFKTIPGSMVASNIAFAFSGTIALIAVVCLTTNLWKTAQDRSDSHFL